MNRKRKYNRKPRLTAEEHKTWGPILKGEVKDALARYIDLAQRFPQQHKIVRTAYASYRMLEKLRSVLDDDICSFHEIEDAIQYYYP